MDGGGGGGVEGGVLNRLVPGGGGGAGGGGRAGSSDARWGGGGYIPNCLMSVGGWGVQFRRMQFRLTFGFVAQTQAGAWVSVKW